MKMTQAMLVLLLGTSTVEAQTPFQATGASEDAGAPRFTAQKYRSDGALKLDTTAKGAPGGVAPLDASARVPVVNLNLDGVAMIRSPNAFFGSARQSGTWLQDLAPGTVYPIVTPSMTLAPVGGVGAAMWVGSRTSDAAQAVFPASNCFIFVDDINAKTGNAGTWCGYVEADLTSLAPGRQINVENSIYSQWVPVQKNPFNVNPLGGSANYRMDCGKGNTVLPTAKACSTALEVINNGGRYLTGVMFGADALAPQPDGLGEALAFGPSQALKWYALPGQPPAWTFAYTGSGQSLGNAITLNDSGMNVTGPMIAASFRATALYTPPTSGATCSTGQFSDDTGYHYVCVATNTWKRVALSTW